MIVDSSAIMALLLEEPEQASFTHAMTNATVRKLSAGNWIELGAVLSRHPARDKITATLDTIMRDVAITIEPVTVEQAAIGHAAYRKFGRGTGHKAAFNFGDCFAYALAKATGEPLLFKSDDFSQTDIVSAA